MPGLDSIEWAREHPDRRVVRGLRLGLTADEEIEALTAPERTAGPMLGTGSFSVGGATFFGLPNRALWYAERQAMKRMARRIWEAGMKGSIWQKIKQEAEARS